MYIFQSIYSWVIYTLTFDIICKYVIEIQATIRTCVPQNVKIRNVSWGARTPDPPNYNADFMVRIMFKFIIVQLCQTPVIFMRIDMFNYFNRYICSFISATFYSYLVKKTRFDWLHFFTHFVHKIDRHHFSKSWIRL
jgi:hypothetical protein